MTHWLVKVDRVYKALKELGKIIKDNYENNKRDFIESLVGLAINVVFVIGILEWVVLPIPAIPKYTGPISAFQLLFVVMKPFWLHIMALFGCLLLLNPRFALFRMYIHLTFSAIIKVRNYYVFVQKGKGKISQ